MRNKLIIIILLFMLSFIHYYHLNSYIIKEETRLVYPEKRIILNQATPVKSPNLYGKYTCLIDASSGRILTQNHCNQQVPMASTTKIMTCLLALEYGKLEQIVTCSKKASSMPKVHLGMSPGNQFRLNDLLYSLMLMSHNDTAVAIAEHIGGSVEGFAAKMNQRAKKIGMKHTNFVTPNGLDANSHYSTAYDMCLLAREALKNEAFRKIITTPDHHFQEIKSNKQYSVSNKDAFLSMYDGAIGIKTGFTSKAGYCFVGAAKRGNTILISTTLAAGWPPHKTYKWNDTTTMMNYGFQNFDEKPITLIDLSKYNVRVKNGETSSIKFMPVSSPILLLGTSDQIEINYNLPIEVTAPIKKGAEIGKILIKINHDYSLCLPVYPLNEVEKSTIFDYFLFILHRFCPSST